VRLTPEQANWQTNRALQEGIASVEARLGDGGRVLIRASGTEPLLRIMVEAADAQLAGAMAAELAALL
jgi:phosphoglucosamine mutase